MFLFIVLLLAYVNKLLCFTGCILNPEILKMRGGVFYLKIDPSTHEEDTFGIPPSVLPTVSSKINCVPRTIAIKHDVWVVGCGTLGEIVLSLLLRSNPLKIVAETMSYKRAESLLSMGVRHRLREQRTFDDEETAKTVIICLPPSSSTNYTEEIHEATRLWAGPDGGGNLIYTSSIAVYGDAIGNTVTEAFRVDTRSASSTK